MPTGTDPVKLTLPDDRRTDELAADHIGDAIDELRDIPWHTAVDDALHDRAGAGRRLFGRLGDDRTSRRQRRCHFLDHQVDREIPRAERCNGPDRLLQHQRTLAGGTDEDAAIAALGFFGEIVKCRGAGGHLGARLGERLSLLGGQKDGDAFGTLAYQPCNLVQDSRALVDIDGAPVREALYRGFKRLVEVGGCRQRQLRQHLARGGIHDPVRIAAFAAVPIAINKQAEVGGITHLALPHLLYAVHVGFRRQLWNPRLCHISSVRKRAVPPAAGRHPSRVRPSPRHRSSRARKALQDR